MWPTAVTTAIWPVSTLSSREVTQIMLDVPEASLATGICHRHPSLWKRCIHFVFQRAKTNLCDAYTLCLMHLSLHGLPKLLCCACKCCLSAKLIVSDGMQHAMPVLGFNFCKRFISNSILFSMGDGPYCFVVWEITLSYNHWVFVHKGCPEAGLPNITLPAHQSSECHYLTALWNRLSLPLETDPISLHQREERNSNLLKIWNRFTLRNMSFRFCFSQ